MESDGIKCPNRLRLAFAMLHEVPDQARLLKEIYDCLKPDGKFLLAEPPIHVSGKAFAGEVSKAKVVGLRIIEQPRVRWARAVLLAKSDAAGKSEKQ
jgi:SAM-dependent methyltransferase